MNERIKQLAEKADIKESLVVQFKGDTQAYVVQYNELEKFAELIVAECIEVFSKDLPEEGDGKMLEVINRVCNVAEHFGVKE